MTDNGFYMNYFNNEPLFMFDMMTSIPYMPELGSYILRYNRILYSNNDFIIRFNSKEKIDSYSINKWLNIANVLNAGYLNTPWELNNLKSYLLRKPSGNEGYIYSFFDTHGRILKPEVTEKEMNFVEWEYFLYEKPMFSRANFRRDPNSTNKLDDILLVFYSSIEDEAVIEFDVSKEIVKNQEIIIFNKNNNIKFDANNCEGLKCKSRKNLRVVRGLNIFHIKSSHFSANNRIINFMATKING